MPFNTPTVTTDNISFGPGRLFLGAAGTTPVIDVGAITEDGITVELTQETRQIVQGNPKIPELVFAQTQGVMVTVTSIEWNFDTFSNSIGAGNTTFSTSLETWAWGGEPCITAVALRIQHEMCTPALTPGVAAHTMYANIWRAQAESGFTVPFTHDEHQFEYKWSGLRATTNWAGATLPQTETLIQFSREKTP